ncbi:hypothetical protein [Nocardia sp. NBC_00508]|uniref:hypothetical protein n=1 Tax=Nocardia sp. NBC_00508 TaxID=2975992 RepID=UPI003FA5FC7D
MPIRRPRSRLGFGRAPRVSPVPLLFIYGDNDPARAEPFHPGADGHVYLAPDANHLARIADLTPADRATATATLERWAAQPRG